jgi:hypothetical protein
MLKDCMCPLPRKEFVTQKILHWKASTNVPATNKKLATIEVKGLDPVLIFLVKKNFIKKETKMIYLITGGERSGKVVMQKV